MPVKCRHPSANHAPPIEVAYMILLRYEISCMGFPFLLPGIDKSICLWQRLGGEDGATVCRRQILTHTPSPRHTIHPPPMFLWLTTTRDDTDGKPYVSLNQGIHLCNLPTTKFHPETAGITLAIADEASSTTVPNLGVSMEELTQLHRLRFENVDFSQQAWINRWNQAVSRGRIDEITFASCCGFFALLEDPMLQNLHVLSILDYREDPSIYDKLVGISNRCVKLCWLEITSPNPTLSESEAKAICDAGLNLHLEVNPTTHL